MPVSIFLPTRKNSQRVPDKNTRPFAGLEGGLLELKLKELVKIETVEEIVLSSNDDRSLEIGANFQKEYPKIKLIERPEFLGTSTTNLSDLIAYASSVVQNEHILWTHVTSPFCGVKDYREMINLYFEKLKQDYDSLISGQPFLDFLWDSDNNDIINRRGKMKWPQTQDLKPLFKINNAAFITSKSIYAHYQDRVGKKPYLYEMGKLSSIDIDDLEDFKIAEALYDQIFK